MRELGDLRTSRVDLASFFRLHFGLEGGCRGRLLDTRDRAPPGGPRSRRCALFAQNTGAAGFFRRAVHPGTHTVPAIQHRAMAQRFSRRAAENILRGIVWKRAAQESSAATLRVAFRRLPTVLPRTVKIHAARCSRLHRRMIGVITVGYDLLRRTA